MADTDEIARKTAELLEDFGDPETDLASLIKRAMELKPGNNEFALFGGWPWVAMIGNTCPMVYLGDAAPEFEGYGDTPEEAVAHLITRLT